MSKDINHWCVICGKGYYACDFCNTTKSFTPWRSLTDSIEHFKIFTILKDYNNNLISKNEAKELLSNIDLSDKDSFKDSSKKLLKDIFSEDVVERKTKKKTNNITKSETVDEKVTEISVDINDTEV